MHKHTVSEIAVLHQLQNAIATIATASIVRMSNMQDELVSWIEKEKSLYNGLIGRTVTYRLSPRDEEKFATIKRIDGFGVSDVLVRLDSYGHEQDILAKMSQCNLVVDMSEQDWTNMLKKADRIEQLCSPFESQWDIYHPIGAMDPDDTTNVVYEWVTSVFAANKQAVFVKGQNDFNEHYAKMKKRSTSVGDIIVDVERGEAHMVCGVGFKQLNVSIEEKFLKIVP